VVNPGAQVVGATSSCNAGAANRVQEIWSATNQLAALRHTHGTLLHSQGTPLKVPQAQLGHSHRATTLDIYTHASESAQRDAVNLLEEQLFPSWRVAEVSRKRKVS
jgi:integrase